jgi:O-acetyl-ADP-ribose deacetylase (regulator of RNase III)
MTNVTIVEGDLLDQPTEAIVNTWNRNVIPWWLLLPQGVSRAIKRKAGYQPFRELARHGPIPLGGAVATSAGCLSYKAIIHVAGISLLWRSNPTSIAESVRSALAVAESLRLKSLAFPIIGAGSGGFAVGKAERIILDTLAERDSPVAVTVVRFRRKTTPNHCPA